MSPLSLISTLYILLLGARGSTSGALSDFLLSDQFYTFNPHLILKNVAESVLHMSRVHDVAFVKQLLVEKPRNPYTMDFFSRTIDFFYGANISEVEPKEFDKKIQETVNEIISKATRGAVPDFLSDTPLYLTPPLSVVSANFFHGRWNIPVTEEDLFDMNFIRFPTAERRLIRTVGIQKKMTVNAGYNKEVGVTTAEVPFSSPSGDLSLVLVMPGEQKNFVANGLAQLEAGLTIEKWSKILRSMLPNTVMFKMPFFRHRSFHNFSSILENMGLSEIFKDSDADFSGINSVKSLHVSDIVQLTEFQSCQVVESPAGGASNSRRAKISTVYTSNKDNHMLRKREAFEPTGYYSPTFIYGLPMTEYLKRNIDNATRLSNAEDYSTYFKNAAPEVMRFRPLSTVPVSQTPSNVALTWQTSQERTEHLEEPKAASFVKRPTVKPESPSVPKSKEDSEEPKAASYLGSPNVEYVDELRAASLLGDIILKESVEDKLKRVTTKPPSMGYGTTSVEGGKRTSPAETTNTENMKEDALVTPALYDESVSGYYDDYYGGNNVYLDPDDYRVNRMGLPEADVTDDGKRKGQVSAGEYYRQSDVGALVFDRAFMYAIRHNPTGLLLFIGRYLDPEGN